MLQDKNTPFLDLPRPTIPYRVCLHVTAKEHLPSILQKGLEPRLGPMAAKIESRPGIWMFPRWSGVLDADWLFDNWPYESEPVLLAVNTTGLHLDTEVDYEVSYYQAIAPWRITVLSDSEENWRQESFTKLGGLA